ncbi:hypothetical protein [Nocardia thraciensis]
MSENKGTAGRARRRVVRSAGPPVDSGGAAQSVERATPTTQPKDTTPSAAPSDEPTVKVGAPSDAPTVQVAASSDAPTVQVAASSDVPTVQVAASSDEPTVKVDAPSDAPIVGGGASADEPTGTGQPSDAPDSASSSSRHAFGRDPETDTEARGVAESGEPSPKKAGSVGILGWAAAVVAVLSALALLGSGVFFLYHENQVSAQDTRRADYAQTAKQAVLNLTNIKGDTAPQDIDRVLAVASGQLKAEYTERKDAYAQVVQQAQVRASGEIIETAVESDDDHSARVLVAAKQTLTNAASPDPQQRYYRFRVTVTRGDDGNLTASQVEFVA